MFQLLYASSAVKLMSDEELLELWRVSRENNVPADISGLLLYRNGSFLQVMEGEETAVKALFSKILRDPRHKDVHVLAQGPAASRMFPDWSMGFKNISQYTEKELPGFSDFLENPFTAQIFEGKISRIQIFLETFKELA